MSTENFNLKISLIEDICRAKTFLYIMGDKKHSEHLTIEDSAALFDDLYQMDISQLTVINDGYGKQINQLLISKLETA